MNKRKKVAWRKHRLLAKKRKALAKQEPRSATRASS